jgi:lysyl-tRNA synthetase, class II
MADGVGSASGLEEKLAGLSTGGGGDDKQNPPPAGEGGEEPQLSKK